jgi:hypothetical protein
MGQRVDVMPPSMTIADDAGVEQLIADVGLRPVRVGDIDAIDIVAAISLAPSRSTEQATPRSRHRRPIGHRR